MRLLAPAKINLHLRVGPAGADGFHPLLTWMCALRLFDTLTLTAVAGPLDPPPTAQAARGADNLIELSCDDPALPCDARNLVVRTGLALAASIAQPSADFAGMRRIKAALQKRIPAGAGLGGGSSDGARMLMGLNRLWSAGWNDDQLARLSARYGSDLPFFFFGPSSICTGRGEQVAPTPAPAARWATLLLPGTHMPTPQVYKQFDVLGCGDARALKAQPDWIQWASLKSDALLKKLVNDLEVPAFSMSPELAKLHGESQQLLGRIVRMSGSGSSLFTLYDAKADASVAARAIEKHFAARNIKALALEVAPDVSDDLI